jgi:hypothetical protein
MDQTLSTSAALWAVPLPPHRHPWHPRAPTQKRQSALTRLEDWRPAWLPSWPALTIARAIEWTVARPWMAWGWGWAVRKGVGETPAPPSFQWCNLAAFCATGVLLTPCSCADCASSDPARRPSWTSVSCGVFICLHCAGIHRGLGTHVSQVRGAGRCWV